MTIKEFAQQFNRAISLQEFKIAGYSKAQVEKAVREGILVWRRDGLLDIA